MSKEHGHNLKNMKQIGSPTEEERIYIENNAYKRIHEEEYEKRRIFILMGHTECEEGRYRTFIEAAIPVKHIEFAQNTPVWETSVWSDIFKEIKRAYEEYIIVGWALDIKGFTPRVTAELEAVHQEQFGGAHQVLFLMDSVEGDEFFYVHKGTRLQQKEGFFIYYEEEAVPMPEIDVEINVEKGTLDEPSKPLKEPEQEKKPKEMKASSYAMVAAVALLVAVVGAGIYQNRISLDGLKEAVSTMGERVTGRNSRIEAEDTEKTTETIQLIPIQNLPAGDIKKTEETSDQEEVNTESQTPAEVDSEVKEPDNPAAGGVQEEVKTDAAVKETYVVEPGDTLTSICRSHYGNVRHLKDVAEINHIENLDDIRVGQKLLLP